MKNRLRKLRNSFACALRGLVYCVRSERNLRIHLTAAVLVLWLSAYYPFGGTEYALLFFAFGLVTAAELINTAVEVLVDLHTQSYHVLARVAKDAAAAGVLLSALACVGVGISLFWQPPVIREFFRTMGQHPWQLIPPALLLVLGWLFVFEYPLGRGKNRHNNK